MTEKEIASLNAAATRCRLNILRMIRASGHGHVGGALSAMDMVAALYFYKLNVDPSDPAKEDRDRFVLSAGHKCLCQYAALAEKGFFEKSVLDTYGSLGSPIPGHPDMHKLPGVEANTGALGHGLAISLGMALAQKIDGKNARTYTLLGDGELAEGSNWEAAAAAAHHKVDNLTAIVDYNGLQISGPVKEVMDLTPISDHFRAFGWAVRDIDGNNMNEITDALDALPFEKGKPSCIVAHTVKAKGLSFGEGNVSYHFWNAKEDQLMQAEEELNALLEDYEKEAGS